MANWCTPCTVGYTVVERYTVHHNDKINVHNNYFKFTANNSNMYFFLFLFGRAT